jgi:UDP-hydrolysing UDP-N-acetyl-D-glucosamine 2-epimerase
MRVGVVTTGRSDEGILEPLIIALGNQAITVSTYHQLENDTRVGQAIAIGSVAKDIVPILYAGNFDKIVLLGDRYETVAVALAAYSLHIPIVHLQGGETTRGSLDDGYRWCISELATWHCAATKTAAKALKRVRLADVYYTGALGCHGLEKVKSATLAYDFVFCYLPAKDQHDPKPYVAALAKLGSVLWIGPNNDSGMGKIKARMLNLPRGVATIASMPRMTFLSTVKASKALVGNSSAGIIEIPSLGVWTINIGRRQEGRELARSIMSCPEKVDFVQVLADKALSTYVKKATNPFYKKDCLEKILEVIMKK